MFNDPSGINPYIIVALVALLVNIPLGNMREKSPKFSAKWLFWIHASIPLIIYLRIHFGLGTWFIPVSIFLAVIGQIMGGRWCKDHMAKEEKERLLQIPPIDTNTENNIRDKDVLIALMNMGGPRTNADVRDFQKRLFSDPLLIRFPLSKLLQGLFAFLLVTFRSEATAKRYMSVGGGSPIYPSTEKQVAALQDELNKRGRNFKVTYTFNYSPPLPGETIRQTIDEKKSCIMPLSLYPHYSNATTGSNLHYLRDAAKNMRPDLKFLGTSSYHLHEGYISAFSDRIREQVGPHETLDQFYLLFSAHGLPLYFLKEGDPYPFQVSQTVANVLKDLNRTDRWSISYQSAVGPLQWIKPSTEDMLLALAGRKIKKIIIVPISFVTDHIETSCEIDIEYRAVAEKAGISDFRMSQAVECHPGFISALADTVEKTVPSIKNREHGRQHADQQVSSTTRTT